MARPAHFRDGVLTIELELNQESSQHWTIDQVRQTLKQRLNSFGVRSINFLAAPKTSPEEMITAEVSAEAVDRTSDIADTELRQAMAALLTAYDKSKAPL